MATKDTALAAHDEGALDRATRWALVRKAFVFQVKLALDGIKDLVLSPMVFVALLFDLVRPTKQPGKNLGRVFRAGLVFEEWLDLWAPARDPDVARESDAQVPLAGGFDSGLSQVEMAVRERLESGQIADKAKVALESLMAAKAAARAPEPHRSNSADSEL